MLAFRPVLAVLVLVLAGVPWVAQGGASQGHQSVATNLQWTPENLTIAPGDSVTFVNAQGTHTFVNDADGASCQLPCTRTYAAPGRYAFHCGVHSVMRGVVSVGAAPSVSIVAPAVNASVAGNVTVSGTATHASEAVGFVEVRVGGAWVGAAVPAADGSWSLTWDSAGVPNGAAVLSARAVTTPTGLSETTTRGVVVANVPVVDLRAVSLLGSTNGVVNATLTYTVANGGNVPSGPFSVLFEYSYKGAWRRIGEAVVADAPAAGSVTGRYVWDASGGPHLGRYPVRATVDPANVVAEPVESNNAVTGSAAWVTPLAAGLDPLDP